MWDGPADYCALSSNADADRGLLPQSVIVVIIIIYRCLLYLLPTVFFSSAEA